MAEQQKFISHRDFEKKQRKQALELIELLGCKVTTCPGGYRIKGPKVDTLVTDLKYVVAGDFV